MDGHWVTNQVEVLVVPDQPPVLMEVTKRPLYNKAGDVTGLIGVAREKTIAVQTTLTPERPIADAYIQAFLTPPPIKENPLQILVVDDMPLMRLALQSLLVMQGEQVTLANTVIHALTALRERAFDLIITDIQMPELSDFDLANYVNQGESPPPIVALSDVIDDTLAQTCFAAGIQAAYQKPISSQQLIELLADCRAGRLQSGTSNKGELTV